MGGEATGILVGALLLAYDRSAARAWRILASLLIASGIVVFMKGLIREPRPPDELWLVEAQGYSFPSGHAAVASALAVSAALGYGLRIGVPLMAYAACVSLSRIVLGVHYPHDVVGGAAIGVLSVAASWRFLKSPTTARLITIALATAIMGFIGSILDPGYTSPLLLASLSLGSALGLLVCSWVSRNPLSHELNYKKNTMILIIFILIIFSSIHFELVHGLLAAGSIIVAARCHGRAT